MNPLVEGAMRLPSMLTTRPCSTSTASEQESGQSSGHAVWTVLRPQVSGALVMGGRQNTEYRTQNTEARSQKTEARKPAELSSAALGDNDHRASAREFSGDGGERGESARARCAAFDAGCREALDGRRGLL